MTADLGNQFHGVGVDEFLSRNVADKIVAPFPSAGRRKDLKDYDADVVQSAISGGELQDVDPSTLRSTQPWVTRSGLRHYAGGSDELFADAHKSGNKNPVVYQRTHEDRTQNVLLSGHHRATVALLEGRPLRAIVAKGGYGPPRKG